LRSALELDLENIRQVCKEASKLVRWKSEWLDTVPDQNPDELKMLITETAFRKSLAEDAVKILKEAVEKEFKAGISEPYRINIPLFEGVHVDILDTPAEGK
jgi:hypothetical protein